MQEAVRHAYYDRFGKPITTSPRLVVPESVPNRTLANIPIPLVPLAPRLPTTNQPVEAARNATTVSGTRSRTQLAAVLVAGVVALGITASAVVWVVSTVHRSTPTTAGSVPSEVPLVAEPAAVSARAPSPAVSSAPAASTPPVVAATDLPTAATQAPLPAAATPPARATATTAVPATATPSCSPPYTIDRATGKKRFKAECL
jgi:hypothetical protein